MVSTLLEKNEIIEKDVEVLINQADIIIENTISNIKREIITI